MSVAENSRLIPPAVKRIVVLFAIAAVLLVSILYSFNQQVALRVWMICGGIFALIAVYLWHLRTNARPIHRPSGRK